MVRNVLLGLAVIALLFVATVFASGKGCFGSHRGPGEATAMRRVQPAAETEPGQKQVLFGDLHVHTTFSFDAFMLNLPMLGGEGAHPPADACDFARFCSALDFWSINDHAEGLTPLRWRETVDAIRQCNDLAGDPANPDSVAFLGWEWTQVGTTPEDHYGHKNVVLAHTEDERIPTRPIAAEGRAAQIRRNPPPVFGRGLLALLSGDSSLHDMARYYSEGEAVAECDHEAHVRDIPEDCFETAATPVDLFRKLDEWGHDAIVIPHGTTWGFYTPPGSSWDKQLAGAMHDPERQTLFEIYSGHGNSDEYRSFRGVEWNAKGEAVCPEPRPDYLPACWQAGEIIRARCLAEGEAEAECEERAVLARARAAAAGVAAHLTVPGARPEEWLDAGQCRDCAEPAFNYRPGGAAQYVLALSNFEASGTPRRFRFGLMSSSDNHFARPGTGYKEVFRRGNTESRDRSNTAGPVAGFFTAPPEKPSAHSRPFDRENTRLAGFQLVELERQASFFLTGGLVAVHAEGRDRAAIWAALRRREVYGTSGPRIQLWFDLLNPSGTRKDALPMGSVVQMSENPIFQVRAVGSSVQRPGCPDTAQALGPERLERLCKGECYHPSDERRRISRIEVVRIRPQEREGELVESLIEDPWRRFECEPDPAGCSVRFEDPDHATDGRDAAYYVRALEEPAPAINAGNLRCDRDASGNCLEVHPCPGPQGSEDDCLAEHEPRAWSSPIFVDQVRR